MKKLITAALILVMIAAFTVGCTNTSVQPDSTIPQETEGQASSAKIAASANDAQGKLIGRIDNNSVEIEMSPTDSPAFRTTEVNDQLEGIKDGDMVKFSYELGPEGQLIITKIEKL